MKSIKAPTFLAAGLALAASAGDAAASGFLVARFGGEQGNPASDHVTSIYFNPAGLALRGGNRILVEGLFAYRSAAYERPASAIDRVVTDDQAATGTPDEAIAANSGTATLGNVAAAPFVGFATDLGVRNLGVGVAAYVPFGGGASWDQNAAYAGDPNYPGAVDGVQRWAAIEGSMRSMYVTAAGAYWFPKARVGFGAGVNLVMSELAVVRARNPDGRDDLVTSTGRVQEGRSLVDAKGTTWSLGAGLMWAPTDTLLVGASYQSRPGFGEMRLQGTLTNRFGASAPASTPVEVRQSLPDVARLGARFRPSRQVELRLSGDYVRWSVFERQCLLDASNPDRNCHLDENGAPMPDATGVQANIERDWQDAWGVRGGFSYWTSRDVEVMGGAGYDGNAAPDATMDAGLMDMNKIFGSIGARISLMRGEMVVTAAYTQFYYFDRYVPSRPRDATGDAMTLDSPSRVPDGAGRYSQSIGVLNVGVEYVF